MGINYTQGTQTIPNMTPQFSVAATASLCNGLPLVEDIIAPTARLFLHKCIGSFNANASIWWDCCIAAKTLIPPVFSHPEFHLVMTNLSPWITNNSWSAIDPALAADLLVSPPHLHSGLNIYGHISDLKKSIDDQDEALWVGHNLGGEVPSTFRFICTNLLIKRWLLVAMISNGSNVVVTQAPPSVKFPR